MGQILMWAAFLQNPLQSFLLQVVEEVCYPLSHPSSSLIHSWSPSEVTGRIGDDIFNTFSTMYHSFAGFQMILTTRIIVLTYIVLTYYVLNAFIYCVVFVFLYVLLEVFSEMHSVLKTAF